MALNKHQILVVDDSTTNNLLMQDILNEFGFYALTVESGLLALNLISQKFPDLVILDIAMPEMDGLIVLKEILKIRNLPIIMFSAIDDKDVIEKAMKLGASDYITKPIIIEEIISKIEKALKINKYSEL